jgi:hypothetical protein
MPPKVSSNLPDTEKSQQEVINIVRKLQTFIHENACAATSRYNKQ